MREIVDLGSSNDFGTFTTAEFRARYGYGKTVATNKLKEGIENGEIIRVGHGIYAYAQNCPEPACTMDAPVKQVMPVVHNGIALADFIQDRGLDWCEGGAVECICTHRTVDDLYKAITYLERIIRHKYAN